MYGKSRYFFCIENTFETENTETWHRYLFFFMERTDCHLSPKINPKLEICIDIFYTNFNFPVANHNPV